MLKTSPTKILFDHKNPAILNIKPTDNAQKKYQAEFSSDNLSSQKHTIFHIDQSSLRPFVPKVSHWSIAWSDLMMTMFILFLSMFIYQSENKEFMINEKFLINDKKEIIGGDTRDALQAENNSSASLPFMVTTPAAPLITSGTVKKIEPVTLQDIDLEETFSAEDIATTLEMIAAASSEKASISADSEEIITSLPLAETNETVLQPTPLSPASLQDTSVNSIYTQSQRTLDNYGLNDFASINLVEDKTVRIVLTGDLLFNTGQATLSASAIASLKKIVDVIHDTPHQINIEGHTDNVPVNAPAPYASNWELSLARANAVASFLIVDMQMNPSQFVISGYSSFRPVAPNTTEQNRASNRRVEIVITKNSLQTQSTDINNNS